MRELKIREEEVYTLPGPLDLTGLGDIASLERPELKYPKFVAGTHRELAEVESASAPDIFGVLRERDVLLHHPYDSFSTSVQAFLEQAAADPGVLAIKQTLYRTSGDSPIVDALIDAAESGKQVLVLVEIKARFDEHANIKWARKLEEAGCHVVYGLVGLKTHCKLSLVVRQEGETLRRYAHVGTGNYHPKTARLYEDLGLLTSDAEVGADLSDLFNRLSGYSRRETYRRLLVAPRSLRDGLLARIGREIAHHRAGRPASIRIKTNAIVDEAVIDALYRASQEGVPVDIWVRGICALRPGVPGLSETIRVRSVLGRFLEHSRVYAFAAGGESEVAGQRRPDAPQSGPPHRGTGPGHRPGAPLHPDPAAGRRDRRHHRVLAPGPGRDVDPALDRHGRPGAAQCAGDADRGTKETPWRQQLRRRRYGRPAACCGGTRRARAARWRSPWCTAPGTTTGRTPRASCTRARSRRTRRCARCWRRPA